MDNKTRGVYKKFIVLRSDGSHQPGKKHHNCEYFVLDLTHDKFAKPALLAYAEACAWDYPKLAQDLNRAVATGKLFNKGGTAEVPKP